MPMLQLFDWVFRLDSARTVRNFKEMIHGRYLHIFSLIFEVLTPHQRGIEEAVRAMAPYTTHPVVLQELLDTWGDAARAGRPDPDAGPTVWKEFWKAAAYNVHVWERHQKYPIRVCDNRKVSAPISSKIWPTDFPHSALWLGGQRPPHPSSVVVVPLYYTAPQSAKTRTGV